MNNRWTQPQDTDSVQMIKWRFIGQSSKRAEGRGGMAVGRAVSGVMTDQQAGERAGEQADEAQVWGRLETSEAELVWVVGCVVSVAGRETSKANRQGGKHAVILGHTETRVSVEKTQGTNSEYTVLSNIKHQIPNWLKLQTGWGRSTAGRMRSRQTEDQWWRMHRRHRKKGENTRNWRDKLVAVILG